jgi:cation:H+ antiporter
VILVALYGALLGLVWWRERRPPAFGEARELGEPRQLRERSAGALGLVLAGIAGMTLGGRLAVAGAERIVSALGLADSGRADLRRPGHHGGAARAGLGRGPARVEELVLAGVLGSAAYNATVTLGAAALIRPLTATRISGPAWLGAALPLLLLLAVSRTRRISRLAGAALLCVYAAYVGLTLV